MEVTQNNIHGNSSRGFTVPSFLKKRKISSLDIPELQELFRINSISFFGELTVEMLKDYLRISYSNAITVIRYLGLYGVIFYSPKLKRFSAQAEEKPLIIKSPRTETTVPVLERVYVFLMGFMYRDYRAKLYRFLSDIKMTSNFLLDGVDINVLSRACDIPSYVIKSLLDLKFYENTYDIYYTEKDTEFVNEIKNILENNKHQNKDVQKRSSTDKVVKNECKSLNEDEPLPTNVQKVPSYIAHMELPIDEFSTRLKGALFNNNITTVEDILKLGFSKFSRLENVGKNTVRELSLFLNKYDVNFNSNQSYQIDEMEAPLQFIEEMNKKNALPKENIQSIPSYIAQMELPMREFSTRLRSALELNSINTIKDALEFGFIHFFRLENVGRNTIKELSLFLNKYNINLEKPYEIFESITLTEGVISYKLRFPFNEFIKVTNPDDDKPLPYEPMESLADKGVEANDNENIQSGYMQSCEPKIMQKKQEVALKNATSLQCGCPGWTIFELHNIKTLRPSCRGYGH